MNGMVKVADLKREYAGTGTSEALVQRHIKRLKIVPTDEVAESVDGSVRSQHFITEEEANKVRGSIAGYLAQRGQRVVAPSQKTSMFYVAAIPPGSLRVKVGWTDGMAGRLNDFRTLVPDVEVVALWDCPQQELEKAAIYAIKRRLVEQERSVRQVGNEVFEGDSDSILRILDEVFAASGLERIQ